MAVGPMTFAALSAPPTASVKAMPHPAWSARSAAALPSRSRSMATPQPAHEARRSNPKLNIKE